VVELAITIIVLGLLLAIGVVGYANIREGMNLQAAEKQVEAALTRAKLSARQENVEYHVIFYPDGGSNANTYEVMCFKCERTYDEAKDEWNEAWSLQPTDNSVGDEKTVSSGDHTYVQIGNSAKITSGGTVIFKPVGTDQEVSFDPAGSEMTINLLSGGRSGSVTVDSQGRITR